MHLDNTKASCFRTCKRKYFLQHVKGLQSDFGSSAIRYGVAFHGMMEGYYNYILKNGWEKKELAITAGVELGKEKWDKEGEKKTFQPDYRTFDSCCKAFLHYISFFHNDMDFIKILGTEKKFSCGIYPDTPQQEKSIAFIESNGDKSPLIFTGRIDLQIEMNFSNWILDFKTTSQNLSMQASRLNRSGQLIGYSYAAREVLDFHTEGCLVLLAFVSAYKSKKTGEYGVINTDFARIPQIYSEGDMKEWKNSFIDTAVGITNCIESGDWPVNYDSCFQFGPCVYSKICQQGRSFEESVIESFHVDFWNVLDQD